MGFLQTRGVSGIERGDQGESYCGGAATKWSPEMLRQRGRTAAHGDDHRDDPTGCNGENGGHEENQKLTTEL
jgi:hypothetical protein